MAFFSLRYNFDSLTNTGTNEQYYSLIRLSRPNTEVLFGNNWAKEFSIDIKFYPYDLRIIKDDIKYKVFMSGINQDSITGKSYIAF